MFSDVENIENNAKLQNWSKYKELLLFDVKTIKTTQNYKRDQITINLHRFDVKTIKKHWGTVAKHSKQRKTTKLIKLQWIASIWHQNNQKCWDTSLNIQNNAKLRKWSNYSALHRFNVKTIWNVQWRRKYWKQCKTTKLIKLEWIAYIWCQNDKNNSKLETRSNYDQFASIWRQNDQKHWGTVAKHSKQRKTTKLIKLQWIASICHQNNQKCWDTSQNIQNNAKLRKWSNYSALHRFDVKTIRNV